MHRFATQCAMSACGDFTFRLAPAAIGASSCSPADVPERRGNDDGDGSFSTVCVNRTRHQLRTCRKAHLTRNAAGLGIEPSRRCIGCGERGGVGCARSTVPGFEVCARREYGHCQNQRGRGTTKHRWCTQPPPSISDRAAQDVAERGMCESIPAPGRERSVTHRSGPRVSRSTAAGIPTAAKRSAATRRSPLASSRAMSAAADTSVTRCAVSITPPMMIPSTTSTAGSTTANSAVTAPRSPLGSALPNLGLSEAAWNTASPQH